MILIDRLPINHELIIYLGSAILRGALQGAIVFGLVWIILRRFPKIHPTICCWLWRIVNLKFLVSLLGIESIKIVWFSSPKVLPVPVTAVSQWIATHDWVPVTATSSVESPGYNLYLYYQWKFWVILWVLGVSLFLIRLALLWLRNWRHSRDLYPVRHPGLVKLYAQFCAQLKIHRPPKLFWSDAISTPSLQGLIHPKIILPAELLTQYQMDEINLMLAHELAHFKCKDLWWNWLPTLTQGLFFFHPLVWIAGREWKEAPEIGCDQLAVQFTGARRVDYGRLLVKATCHPAKAMIKPWFMGTDHLHHQTAGFYQPESKKVLKKRLIALDSQGHLDRKWQIFALVMLAFFGIAAILPWKLTPVCNIKMLPPVTVDFNSELNVDFQYTNHFLRFSGKVSPGFLTINNCDVTVDDEPIPLGVKWYNSGGEVGDNTFSGYLLIEDDQKINKARRIKVVANTDAGSLQKQYVFNISADKSSRL